MSTSGLTDNSHLLDGTSALHLARPVVVEGQREARVVIGARELKSSLAEIRQLRRRCGQDDDLTTDPEYFMAANALGNRRCAAVLIRQRGELEACVLFYEHTRFGMGLGLFRGGDYIGESLVAGAQAQQVQYVHMATQALMKQWRIHGISITMKACASACITVMGPATQDRRFRGTEIQHKLPLRSTYEEMLASLGSRTRRSLAGKRQHLEKSMPVRFVSLVEPDQSLEVMLALEGKAMYPRATEFFYARHRLLRANPDFFTMGLRLPDGAWLSMVSGWRRNGVTYVDLQLNDMTYKKESLSAVMRCYLLEHEIGRKQELINFVGGSSLLLRRYCQPIEANTDIFLCKAGVLARLFEWAARHSKVGSVYERVTAEAEAAGQLAADGPKWECAE